MGSAATGIRPVCRELRRLLLLVGVHCGTGAVVDEPQAHSRLSVAEQKTGAQSAIIVRWPPSGSIPEHEQRRGQAQTPGSTTTTVINHTGHSATAISHRTGAPVGYRQARCIEQLASHRGRGCRHGLGAGYGFPLGTATREHAKRLIAPFAPGRVVGRWRVAVLGGSFDSCACRGSRGVAVDRSCRLPAVRFRRAW